MSAKQKIKMQSSEFEPRNGLVLIKPEELDKGEKTTETGLILATKQNQSIVDRPSTGYVVAAGHPKESVIKVGEFVIWPDTDGLDLEFDDGDFLLIKADSIIGKRK